MEVPRERIVKVPVKKVVYTERVVPKIITQVQEKVIEVPRVQVVEKIVEVPEYVEKIVHVPVTRVSL